jgi:phosphoglucosamine mutase
MLNVEVADRDRLWDQADVWEAVADVERILGDDGRILVRASGTEQLVRVMVEAATESLAHAQADAVAAVVRERLA